MDSIYITSAVSDKVSPQTLNCYTNRDKSSTTTRCIVPVFMRKKAKRSRISDDPEHKKHQ